MADNAHAIKSRNNANAIATPAGSPATVSAPNASSVRTTPNSVLGSGGFGCVLSPPLPNTNAAGSPVNLPGEVMKVFFREGNATKAVTNATMLRDLNNANAPLFSYPVKKYRAAYTKGNIPAALRPTCRIEPTNNLSVPIHAVHMPNLGVSFADIRDAQAAAVAALPLRTLMNGFKNLLNTVRTLYSRGLVHRDIKPQNIMIEPTTGKMTIIDFDILKPVGFLVGATKVQWNSPPETVFWFIDDLFSIDPEIDPAVDPEGAELQKLTQGTVELLITSNIYTSVQHFSRYTSILPAYRDKDAFLQASLWLFEWFMTTKNLTRADGTPVYETAKLIQTAFKMLSTDTFDSFCLAFSIMSLLEKVFPDYHTTAGPLKNLYDTVLAPMVDFNPQTRMRVDAAITQIDTIIAGLPAAGGYKKQKKQKNKTKKARKVMKAQKTQKAKNSKRGATRTSALRQ
jgi:serine/threonine protein kinase